MKLFFYEVNDKGEIPREHLLLKALRSQKKGRYRCELYSTNKRSVNQNSYIHACFTLAQKGLYHAGYEHITTMQAAKDWFKERHLKIEVANKLTGEVYPYIRHTSELSKDEMTWFINVVRDECFEFTGVYIPTPEEYKANPKRYDLVGIAA